MTDSQIINLLGGATRLAPSFDCTVSAVQNWKARGIPWRFRVKVAKLAKQQRVSLPADFLTRGEA